MLKILITGSSGFIGQYLSHYLQKKSSHGIASDYDIVHTYRHLPEDLSSKNDSRFSVGNIDSKTQWQSSLAGVDVVVHLAARVHIMKETEVDPLSAFRHVNTEGTINLARQAVKAGVKRFIYLSSIKVNGEKTDGKPFSPDDTPVPQDPYAVSKYEAEQELLKLGENTGMEIVIIRPPLVYGVGVKGNFATMMNWVAKGVPLPFGAIKNKRSLLALDNLVNFISYCIDHPKAANEIFLISDGEDVSVTELLKKIAKAMNKPIKLLPVPVSWMVFTAKLLGKQAIADRLLSSLQVDNSKARMLLDWEPVVNMEEQLSKMVS